MVFESCYVKFSLVELQESMVEAKEFVYSSIRNVNMTNHEGEVT